MRTILRKQVEKLVKQSLEREADLRARIDEVKDVNSEWAKAFLDRQEARLEERLDIREKLQDILQGLPLKSN